MRCKAKSLFWKQTPPSDVLPYIRMIGISQYCTMYLLQKVYKKKSLGLLLLVLQHACLTQIF